MASINDIDRSEIAAFSAALKAYPSTLSKKDLAARVKGRALRLVARLGKDYAPATVHGVLTYYRNEIRAAFAPVELAPDSVFLRYLKQPKSVADERNRTTRENVAGRRAGQIDVSKSRFIRAAAAALDSPDWKEQAVGVAALTGRRLAEVLIFGKFDEAAAPGHVLFSGQAKTRGADGTTQGGYEIPALAAPVDILRAVGSIMAARPELAGMEYNRFHDLHASKLTNATRAVFSGAFSEVPKSKDLRAAYAAICYGNFVKKNRGRGVSVIEYYARILGHKILTNGGAADLTAASYDYVRVTK